MYRKRRQIEAQGYEYSPEALGNDEYDIEFNDEDELDGPPMTSQDDDY